MKIAIDSTPLSVRHSGISRYTWELAYALAHRYRHDEIALLSDQVEPGVGQKSILDRRWWLWGLPRALAEMKADVFHGTDFSVPYRKVCASVMTVHDLSPWMDPAWHTGAGRVRQRTPWLLKLQRATMIITPTEAVRRQAIDHFKLDPETVRAVPHAASEAFHPVETRTRKNYFLVLGTLEPRKNVTRAVEAWETLKHAWGVELWLAGRRREDAPALPDEPGLRWLGPVEDEELPELLGGARAVLYPTWYEGFGLPVLEAMQCGAVVIASTDAAVREVAGQAALYADPGRTEEWAAQMRAVLEKPELDRRMRGAAIARASQFTWKRTAEMTYAVYKEAIARFRG